jgi:hypothetical protein
MLLLLPLFFAIHLMWAWQDARHAALVAARYVAFDAALGMPAAAGSSARDALRQHVLDGRRRGWVLLDASGAELIEDAGVRVEVLPWDHLDSGLDAQWLWEDWQDALDEQGVEDCRWTPCFDCGVCDQMGTSIQVGPTDLGLPAVATRVAAGQPA